MEFRIQDLLKYVIPGMLILTVILIGNIISNITVFPDKVPESVKDLSAILLLVFLAVSYTFGYFLDGLASLIEKGLYAWLSKPSFELFNGTNKSYKLNDAEKIVKFLCNNMNIMVVPALITKEFAVLLFKTANVSKDKNPSDVIRERVNEYYSAYIFSRNLMATLFLSFIYCIILLIFADRSVTLTLYFILLSFLLMLSLVRWRMRGYYYSRQVIYASHIV